MPDIEVQGILGEGSSGEIDPRKAPLVGSNLDVLEVDRVANDGPAQRLIGVLVNDEDLASLRTRDDFKALTESPTH